MARGRERRLGPEPVIAREQRLGRQVALVEDGPTEAGQQLALGHVHAVVSLGEAQHLNQVTTNERGIDVRPQGTTEVGRHGVIVLARRIPRNAVRTEMGGNTDGAQATKWVDQPMKPSSRRRSQPLQVAAGATVRPRHDGQCSVRRPIVWALQMPANWLYSNGSRYCSATAAR